MAQLLFSLADDPLELRGLSLGPIWLKSRVKKIVLLLYQNHRFDEKGDLFMKHYRKNRIIGLALAIFLFFWMALPALAGQVTLVGEVNDNYQLVANGQIYEIADTPKGNDLAENYISAKVKVTGSVEDSNDMQTLTVVSFEVLPE
jgi:hypothetical protein